MDTPPRGAPPATVTPESGPGHHPTTQDVPPRGDGPILICAGGGQHQPLPGPADLRRYVVYQVVASVRFTGAIWVIFLADRGLSIGQIGLAEACFHLAPLTLELPTGSLADIVGRKWSLAIGSLLGVASSLLMLAVNDVWLALVAMYLAGAAFTFESGAQQAFVYDSLAAGGGADRFSRVFGRLLSLSFLVIGATAWLGGVLADVSFAWPYALSAAFAALGAWLAAGLPEPARAPLLHRSLRRTIGEALVLVRGTPRLAALLLFGSVFWTAVALIELYAQAVLAGIGLAPSMVGLLIGGSLVLVAAGAWVGHRVTSRGSFRGWTIGLAALTAIGALGMGSEVLAIAVVTLLVFQFGTGLYEPFLADRVNRDVAAPRRATILSLQGFLYSLNMVWAFPLVGWVAERAGWLVAFSGVIAVLGLALVAWLVVDRRGDRTG